ncbi:MAG: hypothetical protein ABI205_11830 [Gemmatimonadaceae bacterium]
MLEMYTCSSSDMFHEWYVCRDEGQASVFYQFDESEDDGWTYASPFDCSSDLSNCPTGSATTTGGNYGLAPEPASANDNASEAVPSCNPMPMTDSSAHAWCLGVVPGVGSIRLIRIKSALDAMRAINQTCAVMASIGDSLLANDRLRIFVHDGIAKMGGAAPQYGGWSGPDSWMALSTGWTDINYDSNHEDGSAAHRDLQQALAHELDHLFGSTPIHTDQATLMTLNSQTCGGV